MIPVPELLRSSLKVPDPVPVFTVTVLVVFVPETKVTPAPVMPPVLVMLKSEVLTPVTFSEKVTKNCAEVLLIVALPVLVMLSMVGVVVLMTISLLAPKEFAAPGAARVKVASFPAASLMVPPARVSAAVLA
ncbi:hypothetical protein D3C87_185600 [compost metagenome]